MDKLQQFYIYSLQSKNLKRENYKINTSISEARKNDYLISLGESQLIRTIRDVKDLEFSPEKLAELWQKRAKIKKRKSSDKNILEISKLSEQIDKMLFVDDIISVSINHASHYRKMVKDGFFVNGRKYVRFMASAGHLRKSTVFFISESIEKQVRKIFENGMDKTIPLNYGKFGAYHGLFASSSRVVSTPSFVVVPDLEIKRMRKVDFVEDDNETVYEREMEIVNNCFDGQGLVTIQQSKLWSYELGLDYNAVQFIIRAPFTKGLLVAFPIHEFARKHNINTIIDIYGQMHNIFDVDVILTESQFKMHSHYKSLDEFSENCKKNKLSWGITRVNQKKEKTHFFSSYQYLQVLNKEVDIDKLTEKTIEYFKDISTLDANKSLLYLMGDGATETKVDFNKIDNNIVKVLGLDKSAIKDPYIEKTIIKSLNRKIKDSYTGKLLMDGNYQFLVFDCVALLQHALSMNINSSELGLLKEGQTYSKYWNSKNVKKVVSGRSPLTWRSELVSLNLVNGKEYDEWYGHLYSGIVFSIHGVETMLYGDADGDGDALFTTSDGEMIKHSLKNGIPVTYDKKKAPKEILDYSDIWKYDIKGFSTKIGVITNAGTTCYALQSLYKEGTEEYDKLEERLKICRRGQGQEIDSVKGIETSKFPDWSKRIQGNDLNNRLLTDKKPHWFIYLYSHRKREWDNLYEMADFYSQVSFDMTIDELLSLENPNEEQEKIIEKFKRLSPVLITSNGVMDKVSKKMVESIKEFRLDLKNNAFDYSIYKSGRNTYDKTLKEEIKKIIKLYNRMKKDFYLSSLEVKEFRSMESIFDFVRKEIFTISSDMSQLTDVALDVCYGENKSNYEFVWDIFGDGIINHLIKKNNLFSVPVPRKTGEITFLGNRYSLKEFSCG